MKYRVALLLSIAGAFLASCVSGEDAQITSPESGWWENAPSADDILAVYPTKAYYSWTDGRVVLNCLILPKRSLDCVVQSETPPAFGFGEAALSLSHIFVVRPVEKDPRLRIGSRIVVPIEFQAEARGHQCVPRRKRKSESYLGSPREDANVLFRHVGPSLCLDSR